MRIIFHTLGNLPKYQLLLLSAALVLFFGFIDYGTGPDLSIFIFYLIPVFLSTWFVGISAGVLLSVVSAAAWSLADVLSRRTPSDVAIPYGNLIVQILFFLIVVYTLSALKASLEQEKQLARSDYLTGAVNSRYFTELAAAEISRSRRYYHPFTVVYMDVDNFKAVNDRFGHSIGDALLQQTVRTIRGQIRATDTIARVGGDEFILLLPETGIRTAITVLEKIRASLFDVMQERSWPVTFSFGMAAFDDPPESVDTMIKLADDLMYEGKNNGKNSIRYRTYRNAQSTG
ncbi:MAG TPA: GGDEF domain-containing protein [Nitrospirota bacterium]|nr:GGDEF domain-containing protein [Nitrospirota bacterium]